MYSTPIKQKYTPLFDYTVNNLAEDAVSMILWCVFLFFVNLATHSGYMWMKWPVLAMSIAMLFNLAKIGINEFLQRRF